jgi:hypothetical protein
MSSIPSEFSYQKAAPGGRLLKAVARASTRSSVVIGAIDLLAEALTGDRERFHQKAHGAPVPPAGKVR